jgi:hypothetical protein
MKKFNYENGYAKKIEYWSGKLVEATQAGDRAGIRKAAESLEYFVARQLSHLGSGPVTKVEWTYNFEEGGWNQEWATSLEEAFHQAVSAHPSLTPDRDSFRRASEEEVAGLLSLFY